jgi:hypothetical protein
MLSCSKVEINGECSAVHFDSDEILSVLDDSFNFPMLDNGYVYLAATRLELYRSVTNWAMVVEVFGFSPRTELPDTCIHTFARRLHDRNPPENYVSREAYEYYLSNNSHNESRFFFPIDAGSWQDSENGEFVDEDATEIVLRGQALTLPNRDEYDRHVVALEQPSRIQVFELCRFLADIAREQVLATRQERRVSVMPDMSQVLQLEEWHHPDLGNGERPSRSETFQQLAQVLATGDAKLYHPSRPPNTHWSNWPEGGRL